MADIVDMAQEEMERLQALQLRAAAAQRGPAATGSCLSCGEPLASGLRWCDADCRDDWEVEQRAAQRNRDVS